MNRVLAIIGAAVFAFATPSLAQEPSSSSPTLAERLLQAIQLPFATNEARDVGVPDDQLREVLVSARERRVSASEIQALLGEEVKAVKEHGRIDNFGAFVKSKLDAGLRGRALADAIHAEHAARGMGKGAAMGKGTAMNKKDARANGSDKKKTR